jgi:hypothetical protein
MTFIIGLETVLDLYRCLLDTPESHALNQIMAAMDSNESFVPVTTLSQALFFLDSHIFILTQCCFRLALLFIAYMMHSHSEKEPILPSYASIELDSK